MNYNQASFSQLINEMEPHPGSNFNWFFEYVYSRFDKFEGIHDRAILLYSLFLSFKMNPQVRPAFINAHPQKVMEMMIKLFEDIQKCRQIIAQNETDSEDDDSDDEGDDSRNIDEDLQDSDDDVNDSELGRFFFQCGFADANEYIKSLTNELELSDSDDDEERHSFVEVTEMEEFETPFDGEKAAVNVHVLFMQILEDLHNSEADFYGRLVLNLDEGQKKRLGELIELCKREQEHLRSQQLNSSGGYAFDASAAVPSQFNFN